ncbi:unannotated protein [freshwater metagenome]|uniref:Unannotated protein n=1 Tax=freshwater metagenome TaxID=449393 RepID=A0A6J7VSJ1_9ZZZZ
MPCSSAAMIAKGLNVDPAKAIDWVASLNWRTK